MMQLMVMKKYFTRFIFTTLNLLIFYISKFRVYVPITIA